MMLDTILMDNKKLILLKILIIFFTLEYGIMLLLSIPIIEANIPSSILDFIDPLVLSLVGFFPLWYWIIKPIDDQRSKAVEKLADASKMIIIGEIAGGIAHEINNPLAIVMGKAEVILGRLNAGIQNTDQLKEDILKIELSANRIKKIVSGLKAFAKKSDDELMRTVKITEIIENALDFSAEKTKAQNINITINCDPEFTIHCRPFQMTQALLNLFSNSFDAIQNLPQKWIEITVIKKKRVVSLSFIDSGGGIDPAIQIKMMNPFFTTKDIGQGAGLGLSITKGIIESHNGSLIYDRNSKNTRFIIELPLIFANQNTKLNFQMI
jgi:C4-dicarboxylate-specific signal transduction histidine kinase